MTLVEQLKKIVNDDKVKFDNFQARNLVLLYRKNKDVKTLKQLQKLCYPLILGALKYYLINNYKKNPNWKSLVNNDEFVTESFLTLNICIQKFKVTKNAGFGTYLWTALIRKFIRFNEYYNKKKYINRKIELVDDLINYEGLNDNKLVLRDFNFELKQNNIEIKNIKIYLLSNLEDYERKIFVYLLHKKSNEYIKEKLGINWKIFDKKLKNLKLILRRLINE